MQLNSPYILSLLRFKSLFWIKAERQNISHWMENNIIDTQYTKQKTTDTSLSLYSSINYDCK